jgi:hypothetical protein
MVREEIIPIPKLIEIKRDKQNYNSYHVDLVVTISIII